MAAIRRRDPAALTGVVEACLAPLLRAARGAGLNREQAEDLVQSTFLAFLRKAEQYDGRARVQTYLFAILYNKLSELRRAPVWETPVDDIETAIESEFSESGRWSRPPRGPERHLGRREVVRYLRECLKTVPDRQRDVFLLHEVEGLTRAEICNALDLRPNNVGVLLYRARSRLRECLERMGIHGSHDAVL